MKNFSTLKLFPLALAFCGIVWTSLQYQYPSKKRSKQQTAWLLDPRSLQAFSLGFDRALSTLLWTETLMNSDIEKYEKDDLKNWFYIRLKGILTLDPKFYTAYVQGALYLSIIKDDELGAKKIYEQGLKYFPDDYQLNLSAGFHDYFEMGNPQEAIDKWKKIINFPETTLHIKRLLAKMISSHGNIEEAFSFVKSLWSKASTGSLERNIYEKNLYAIQAEIDLTCLNQKRRKCSKVDFYGIPYVLQEGEWIAQRKWEKFQVSSIGKKSPSKKRGGGIN